MPPAVVNSGYSAPVPARSLLLPGLLIVAGTLALACALWWILKRKDLHRWMWAAIPLLSAAAAAALILLAGSSQANRPMAVIISNLVQDSTGGIRDYSSISAAPDLPGRHEYSMEGETLKMQAYEFNYYYMEDEDEPEEPDRLRTCYTGGAECAAVVESHGLREQATLVSESVSRIRGQIDGAVWMEEDGLHGEIVNGTDQTFAPGWVITTYGYTRTAALAPGEKAEVLLTKRTAADPQDPKYEEGGLYLNGELSLYGIASGAMGCDYTRYANGDGREAVLTTMLTNAADQLNRDKGNQYGYAETTMFLYCAEPEYLPRPVFKADGKAVEQQTSLTLLTAELAYTAVGRTGVVFRSAGMDIPERVETDMLGRPTDMALPMKPAYYHVLSDIPTFRFDLKGMGDMQISMLRVTMDTYTAGNIKGCAFNIRTGQWDEITLNEDIKKPEQYLDPAGKLYVQFRANSGTQDTYLEMPSPSIMLEGRMPNAAD